VISSWYLILQLLITMMHGPLHIRAYICCRPSIYANAKYKVKVRKMAAPLSLSTGWAFRYKSVHFTVVRNWSNDLWIGLKKISNALQCNRWRKGSWPWPRWWKDLCSQRLSRKTAASLLTESHFQEEPIPYSSHISDNPFDAHTEYPVKTSEAHSVIPQGKGNVSTCASFEHEASDRVSWLGFLWPPSDTSNKHHDRGPTSNPTNEPSRVLTKLLGPNPIIPSQTKRVQ